MSNLGMQMKLDLVRNNDESGPGSFFIDPDLDLDLDIKRNLCVVFRCGHCRRRRHHQDLISESSINLKNTDSFLNSNPK